MSSAGRELNEVDDHRSVVGGALAGALVAVDEGAGDARGEGGRAEDEVDAHAAVPLEALAVVVPVGEDVGAGGVRADDVDPAVVEERLERRAFAGE